MLSRKYYKLIARVINNNITQDVYGDELVHKDDLIDDLCLEFKADNYLFNRDRFIDACND